MVHRTRRRLCVGVALSLLLALVSLGACSTPPVVHSLPGALMRPTFRTSCAVEPLSLVADLHIHIFERMLRTQDDLLKPDLLKSQLYINESSFDSMRASGVSLFVTSVIMPNLTKDSMVYVRLPEPDSALARCQIDTLRRKLWFEVEEELALIALIVDFENELVSRDFCGVKRYAFGESARQKLLAYLQDNGSLKSLRIALLKQTSSLSSLALKQALTEAQKARALLREVYAEIDNKLPPLEKMQGKVMLSLSRSPAVQSAGKVPALRPLVRPPNTIRPQRPPSAILRRNTLRWKKGKRRGARRLPTRRFRSLRSLFSHGKVGNGSFGIWSLPTKRHPKERRAGERYRELRRQASAKAVHTNTLIQSFLTSTYSKQREAKDDSFEPFACGGLPTVKDSKAPSFRWFREYLLRFDARIDRWREERRKHLKKYVAERMSVCASKGVLGALFHIATGPEDAAAAVSRGEKALILHLEQQGLLRDQRDIAFYQSLDVRMSTMLHLSDNHLSGAAHTPWEGSKLGMSGDHLAAFRYACVSKTHVSEPEICHQANPEQPAAPRQLMCKVERNRNQGLTRAGLTMFKAMTLHGVMTDMSHLSETTTKQLLRCIRRSQRFQPVPVCNLPAAPPLPPPIHTHTNYRYIHSNKTNAEYALSEAVIQEFAQLGGLLGMGFHTDALEWLYANRKKPLQWPHLSYFAHYYQFTNQKELKTLALFLHNMQRLHHHHHTPGAVVSRDCVGLCLAYCQAQPQNMCAHVPPNPAGGPKGCCDILCQKRCHKRRILAIGSDFNGFVVPLKAFPTVGHLPIMLEWLRYESCDTYKSITRSGWHFLSVWMQAEQRKNEWQAWRQEWIKAWGQCPAKERIKTKIKAQDGTAAFEEHLAALCDTPAVIGAVQLHEHPPWHETRKSNGPRALCSREPLEEIKEERWPLRVDMLLHVGVLTGWWQETAGGESSKRCLYVTGFDLSLSYETTPATTSARIVWPPSLIPKLGLLFHVYAPSMATGIQPFFAGAYVELFDIPLDFKFLRISLAPAFVGGGVFAPGATSEPAWGSLGMRWRVLVRWTHTTWGAMLFGASWELSRYYGRSAPGFPAWIHQTYLSFGFDLRAF